MIGSGLSWEESLLCVRCYQSTDVEVEEKHTASPRWACNSLCKSVRFASADSVSASHCVA